MCDVGLASKCKGCKNVAHPDISSPYQRQLTLHWS